MPEEFSILLETAISFSYSPSHHKVSHRTNKCLYCDYANGGTGSDMDASWTGPIKKMNDLVKPKLSHLMPGPVLHPHHQRLLSRGHK